MGNSNNISNSISNSISNNNNVKKIKEFESTDYFIENIIEYDNLDKFSKQFNILLQKDWYCLKRSYVDKVLINDSYSCNFLSYIIFKDLNMEII